MNTDNNEMGQKLLRLIWDPFLKTGMTLANLKQSGTTPFVKDRLNIVSNDFDMRYLISFNIFVGILLGPVA
mgnify:CR=1 FL=1